METAALNKVVSPVNIESRKGLGIKPGDTVRVSQKIEERGKTRIQIFEGLVLSVRHGTEPGAAFTVRRVSGGFGVEKIFPLYSPLIDKIEIVRRSKVRRAKLYYIREKVAKEIRRQMRNMTLMDRATGSDIEEKAQADKEAEVAEKEAEESTEQPEAAKTETPQAENDSEAEGASEDAAEKKGDKADK
jgi:large subunit ribosomal protein L19